MPHLEQDQLEAQRSVAIESPPRLPEFVFSLAGETPELQRLRNLEERIKAFTQQQPPKERGLPPLAAIAAGALGALAPAEAERLRPDIERFRRAPIDEFERLRRAQAEALQLEASLIPAFTEAEQRQRVSRELTGAIQQHFDNANEIIEGASEAAKQLAQDESPARRLAAAELMRRVTFYRELVANAQTAEPGTVGERFLAQAETETQAIAGIINSQNVVAQAFEQKVDLLKMSSALAFQRAVAIEEIRAKSRAAMVGSAAQMRDFRKASEGYAGLSQFLPILNRMEQLIDAGVGGPVAGQLGAFGPGGALRAEFAGLRALLVSEIFFGEGGKQLALHEKQELAAKLPEVTALQTGQKAQLAAARLQIRNKLTKLATVWKGFGFDITQFDLSAAAGVEANLAPGEAAMGSIDLEGLLLGLEEEEP